MTPAPMSEGELTEGAVLALLRKHFDSETQGALTYTQWKDSIDIDRVSGPTMAFARDVLALRAPRKEQRAVAWTNREALDVMEMKGADTPYEQPMWSDSSPDHNIPLYASPNGGREERDEALVDVAAERERQKAVEGWTAEHDDNHVRGEMALAAAAYAVTDWPTGDIASIAKGVLWPWEDKWWKPKDFRSNLVRAAALLVAEIERHDRKEAAITLRAQPHVEEKP